MTVRLSAKAARFIDEQVAGGEFSSRAQYLDWLVDRASTRHRTPVDFSARGDAQRVDHHPEMAEFRNAGHAGAWRILVAEADLSNREIRIVQPDTVRAHRGDRRGLRAVGLPRARPGRR